MVKIVFGVVTNIARQDKAYAIICTVATCCETVAFVTRLVKIPGGIKVYVVCKYTSAALMKHINLCKNAKGEIFPC